MCCSLLAITAITAISAIADIAAITGITALLFLLCVCVFALLVLVVLIGLVTIALCVPTLASHRPGGKAGEASRRLKTVSKREKSFLQWNEKTSPA